MADRWEGGQRKKRWRGMEMETKMQKKSKRAARTTIIIILFGLLHAFTSSYASSSSLSCCLFGPRPSSARLPSRDQPAFALLRRAQGRITVWAIRRRRRHTHTRSVGQHGSQDGINLLALTRWLQFRRFSGVPLPLCCAMRCHAVPASLLEQVDPLIPLAMNALCFPFL
jgi:hypothetical protein